MGSVGWWMPWWVKRGTPHVSRQLSPPLNSSVIIAQRRAGGLGCGLPRYNNTALISSPQHNISYISDINFDIDYDD